MKMNYIVFDCETTNTMDDPIVYDLGWSVINDKFEVLAERSFVNADVFIEEKDLMKVAYFADKIPQYVAEIADGTRELRRFETIRRAFALDCEMFGVTEIYAHNARFDEGCLRAAFATFDLALPNYEFMDTLAASRNYFGSALLNHQLHTVAAACGYDLQNHHHALADAEACAWIAREIL